MIEPSYLTATRTAYDTVAVDYEEQLRTSLAGSPLERVMLAAFAELVLTAGAGPVADLGCGPGRATGYLASLGLDVFGVDLSPTMVEVARGAHPGVRFEVGSMMALDVPDGALGGVVAWYSIIHTPPELLPLVFAEFARVLAPGGHLALGFQVGDERVHVEHAYGHEVSVYAYRLAPAHIVELMRGCGLDLVAQLVSEPGPTGKTPQASLLARKPS